MIWWKGKKELEEILDKGKFSKLEMEDFNKILKYLDEDKDFIINYFDKAIQRARTLDSWFIEGSRKG